MATTTANTILKYSVDGTLFNKLVDIVSYPDMGSAPSKLDSTDLSATKFKTSILGLQEVPDLTFEANYDKTAYDLISGLTDVYELQLIFNDGADGGLEWSGQVSVFINGGGVDEIRKMTVTCSAETEIQPMA